MPSEGTLARLVALTVMLEDCRDTKIDLVTGGTTVTLPDGGWQIAEWY